MWSPEQYHRYRGERSRPFFDLLAQVDLVAPRTIVDLGCGTGELTATLLERWPEASVLGIDSSKEMIDVAATHREPDRLEFALGDLATWEPSAPVDLLFSNAAFQWVGNHEQLIPRLVDLVAPGGVLAFQVPANFTAPSHTILYELLSSPRWVKKLGHGNGSASIMEPSWYVEILTSLGMKVSAWETVYHQILQGENAVLEWVKGTALRPVLAALDESEKIEFLEEYAGRLRAAYPQRAFGTLFPFRRLFVVGRKG
jgi:trans-aconitate 2-methyltransferase